ncbi:MAG: site-specific DNA-methyltransferase [Thermoplasmata archaeon]|uniref:Site-specific DNA-methyltransferase n=1 Tax=Candidatus Sysuiplasma superficiale TaxID=2823368 RepID=A0A8J7YP03_9ARCH|nr:site-specific DNA-methyltransferase [Candidatus Sysuiplasma superficiale]MBX8644238.1 site-specific DNA-methyltransferase [Candidatus Sysuiplasma superficiale]MCL4346853.1 site-specific DNA-methyltransferase [Candidatus Thermoplasmatota archaeon]
MTDSVPHFRVTRMKITAPEVSCSVSLYERLASAISEAEISVRRLISGSPSQFSGIHRVAQSIKDSKDADGNAHHPAETNLAVLGDNLNALALLFNGSRELHMQSMRRKLKLVYIDPPFGSNSDYGFNLEGAGGRKGNADHERIAYSDRWNGGLITYAEMLAPRLIFIRELLRDDGSLFLHCDWHAGHYIKTMLDAIFGPENYRNEIITGRGQKKNLQYQFPGFKSMNVAYDTLFWYSRTPDASFNPPMREAADFQMKGRWQSLWNNADRPTLRYPLLGCSIDRGQWKWRRERSIKAAVNYEIYLREKRGTGETLEEYWQRTGMVKEFVRRNRRGRPEYWVKPRSRVICDNNWLDLRAYDYSSGMRTQKSEMLLERILQMGSSEGDIVADFFAGSGTTAVVAEKMGRRWISCDIGGAQFSLALERIRSIARRPFSVINLADVHS